MTASLPRSRLRRIQDALASIGETLGGPVDGPSELQDLKRYRRDRCERALDRVKETIARGGKVLWVVNTVGDAMEMMADPQVASLNPLLYHSRFRYRDRVTCHKKVIEAFARPGTQAFAITTQVAEMSLDLSADLLVTQLAPIFALIQRLGRLNRRLLPGMCDGVRPFIILPRVPGEHLPYTSEQLDEAERWLEKLGDGEISQADLIEHWVPPEDPPTDRQDRFIWLDGGFTTEPRPLRIASPGIEIILAPTVTGCWRSRVDPKKCASRCRRRPRDGHGKRGKRSPFARFRQTNSSSTTTNGGPNGKIEHRPLRPWHGATASRRPGRVGLHVEMDLGQRPFRPATAGRVVDG